MNQIVMLSTTWLIMGQGFSLSNISGFRYIVTPNVFIADSAATLLERAMFL